MLKKMGKPKIKEFRFSKKDYSWKKELEEFYIDITKKRVSSPGLIDIYKKYNSKKKKALLRLLSSTEKILRKENGLSLISGLRFVLNIKKITIS